MSFFSPILAQSEEVSVSEALGAWSSMNDETRYQLILAGACVLVILGLLIWAAFFRKAKKKRRRIAHPHGWQKDTAPRSKHRHHRRNRDHPAELPRNPTLAETGGLPPVRPQTPESPDGHSA